MQGYGLLFAFLELFIKRKKRFFVDFDIYRTVPELVKV